MRESRDLGETAASWTLFARTLFKTRPHVQKEARKLHNESKLAQALCAILYT